MVRRGYLLAKKKLFGACVFRFKLFLEPRALRDESAIDPRLPQIPVRAYGFLFILVATYMNPFCQPGKKAVDLIIDFLSCLWEYAKEQITREIGAVADLSMFGEISDCILSY